MDEKLDLITTEEIQNLIYTVRGKQVMLDSDVANLYHYKTKSLNLAVKRNIERFPEEFCFQLTEEEFENLRFQFETLKKKTNNGRVTRKYLPYVFIEQGIAMLAGVLRSDIAVNTSINIIKAFIAMRNFLRSNGQVFERLTSMEYKLLEHDKKFDLVFDKLQENQIENQRIFFNGQIYDAYNLIIDMQKFNGQYPTLKVAKTNKFHDRFIILDEKEMYHLGASIKDLGKKCFGINKIEDEEIIKSILKVV